MKQVQVTFRMPTGYVGVDIDDLRFFDFEDDISEDKMHEEILAEFGEWVEDTLEDLRMSAEYDIEEYEFKEV